MQGWAGGTASSCHLSPNHLSSAATWFACAPSAAQADGFPWRHAGNGGHEAALTPGAAGLGEQHPPRQDPASLAHRHLPPSLLPATMGPPHTTKRDGTGSLRGAAARPFRPARLPAAPMAAGGPEAAQQQVRGTGGR